MRVPFIPYVQGRNDYDDGDNRKYGFAIHNTSNDASDSGEASYAARRTDGVSAHLYADADSVTQSIDTEDKTGHAGSSHGNENAISVEITGANGKSREWWLANVAWDLLGRVIAYLIKNDPDLAGFQVRRASVAEMKANPRVKAFYSHDDMRRAWGGTTHTDPGVNFPWDKLFAVVNAALGQTEEDDVFCKYGDQGPKVEDLQRRIVRAGATVGVVAGTTTPDYDGRYGDNTAKGLAALVGGDGKTFGPSQDVALLAKLIQKLGGAAGPAGPPGPRGPQGPPGQVPSALRIVGTAEVVE